MILAPFAAMIVQMAISRTREYAADGRAHLRQPALAGFGAGQDRGNAAHLPTRMRNEARHRAYVHHQSSFRRAHGQSVFYPPSNGKPHRSLAEARRAIRQFCSGARVSAARPVERVTAPLVRGAEGCNSIAAAKRLCEILPPRARNDLVDVALTSRKGEIF